MLTERLRMSTKPPRGDWLSREELIEATSATISLSRKSKSRLRQVFTDVFVRDYPAFGTNRQNHDVLYTRHCQDERNEFKSFAAARTSPSESRLKRSSVHLVYVKKPYRSKSRSSSPSMRRKDYGCQQSHEGDWLSAKS